MPIKHRLNNGRYIEIYKAKIFGVYDDDKAIIIDSRNRRGSIEELDTLLHETLHAECPDYDEDTLDKAAASQARLLWSLGWRLKKTGKKL